MILDHIIRAEDLPPPIHEEDCAVPGARPRKLRVCVIGGGPSGLATVKELLDEGHEVVCYEKEARTGGVFYFTANDDRMCAYDSCRLTISASMMAFSDFPPSESDAQRFWYHYEYLQYLDRYIEHFGLARHIHTEVQVTSIARVANGAWQVTTEGTISGIETFDAVAVCSGAHRLANRLTFPGQQTSSVEVCHSETYTSARGDPRFEGKRVVVIGVGESGADVVSEISDVSERCWLALRRPPLIIARYPGLRPWPSDAYTTRALFYPNPNLNNLLLYGVQAGALMAHNPVFQRFFKGRMRLGDAASFRLASNAFRTGAGAMNQYLSKTDVWIPNLLAGKIVEKPAVERLEGGRVFFTDGSSVEADTVMCCTGFRDDFSFIEDVEVGDMRQLYKHSYHRDVGPSLAFIGWCRPTSGGIPACAEMQARYFALLCSGRRKLPDDWRERAAREGAFEDKLFFGSPNIKSLVLYAAFMESLAVHVGCRPNLWRYASKPRLWRRLYFGEMVPNQYRLRGPHAQPEQAMEVIEKVPVVWTPPIEAAQTAFALLSKALEPALPPSW